jgi:hypothetical protein
MRGCKEKSLMMLDAMSQTQRLRKCIRSLHCGLDLCAAFLDMFYPSLRYICTKLGPLPACLPNLSCVCLMAVFCFVLGYGQMCHVPERRGFAAGQCHDWTLVSRVATADRPVTAREHERWSRVLMAGRTQC